MAAYSFNKQFVSAIHDRTKTGTIRAFRAAPSRNARDGEAIQIYTGMRTKYVTLQGRAICQQAKLVWLNLGDGAVYYPNQDNRLHLEDELNIFAVADGFKDWDCLCQFWRENHKGIRAFEGVHILWGSTFVPAEAR